MSGEKRVRKGWVPAEGATGAKAGRREAPGTLGEGQTVRMCAEEGR